MKMEVLLLALASALGVADAQARTADPNEPSRLVVASDASFVGLRERYTDLEGAYLVSTTRGAIRHAAFRRADFARMRHLAEILLDETLTAPGSTWVEDDELARVHGAPDVAEIVALQHRVDNVDVEGSFVLLRRRHDGSGELFSSLAPVASTPKPLLAPRHAFDLAVGKASPVESMSASISPDAEYTIGEDGYARLAYRAETQDARRKHWILHVDARDGRLLSRSSRLSHLDSAPDDLLWTVPPLTWTGWIPPDDQAVICTIVPPPAAPTDYYPAPPYLLNPIGMQFNIAGPANRLRNASLGLTSINWGQTPEDLMIEWPAWNWSHVAARIFQRSGPILCENTGKYPSPAGYPGDVLPGQVQVNQHIELQTAMEDIRDRFGWKGLKNQYDRLVLVQNVVDPDLAGCGTDVKGVDGTRMIYCPLDTEAVIHGMPERIPAVETLAHEFSHTILYDRGLTSSVFEKATLAEALADLFAVAVKARHGGNPWLIGDRPGYMERQREWQCASGQLAYCNSPAMLAVRDLANPKTMNPINPGAEYYQGENYGPPDEHPSSQVVSHMMYRLAQGAPGGARDGNPALGTYEEFAGIGMQEMLELFAGSLPALPLMNQAGGPQHRFAEQVQAAAITQCGQWSEAELVAHKAAWIARLSMTDVDLQSAGYVYPLWGELGVTPIAEFLFDGEATQKYHYQVAADANFMDIVHEDVVVTDGAAQGRFTLKLAPHTEYWWRVRLANAPMISSKWVVQDEACWRPAAPFRTGEPMQVTNAKPAGATAATGDEVEPWNVEFSWTGNPRFDGYEFWVDDEEPEGGKYSKVWAHKLFEGKDVPVDTENPGSADETNLAVPPIPLPKSRHLCWKIVPFVRDDQGKRVDGDPLEQCFRTSEPQTQITHPAPPAADGTLSHAPAQPLAIDYDPADGAASHEFSLVLLQLAGFDVPPAQGQWAYQDDVGSDPANMVKEAANPPDWTTRTRLRMLPVQLDAGPYVKHALGKVRLTIKSLSPIISSKELNGGTYPPFREYAQAAVVDFHPSEPANYTALHPFVTAPPAMGTCSSSDSPELSIAWDHGKDATPEAVEKYHIKLYPEHCGNGQPSGCQLLGDPLSPDFVDTLALDKSVKHNGKASQRVEFSRAELFPSEASETNLVTGFLAHLYGVSGPVPGPAGLNITGRMIVDLPVLPATLRAGIEFHDGGIEHPEWTEFRFWPETNVNAEHPYTLHNQFAPPKHEIRLRAYRGAGCLEENFITEAPDRFELDLDQTGLSDDPNPVVSVRATMTWASMLGPVLTSGCTVAHGINRQSKPEPVSGLTAREAGGQLGASWDVSTDANPETLEYFIGLAAQGNDSANMLVNHPATVMLTNAELQSIEDQIGLHSLAVLDPSDIGKNVILRVMVCRAGTDKCSDEVTAMYTIGSAGLEGPLPTSPLDLALHFEEDAGLPIEGGDPIFQSGWITASWNPPAGATDPSYYLVTFSATGDVPGVLPNWLNTLNIAGVNFPADPLQYSAVIRALPEGVVLTNTNWASFVWLLAETHQSGPPATGTWVTARVWACAGTPPLPPLRAHDWIVGASTETCGVPAEVSAQYP